MRIVISGGSGLLGSQLVPSLRADGHEVVQLVRRPARGAHELTWDPARGELDLAAMGEVDAAINLSGAGVEAKRWSDAYKREIRESRVTSTRTLATALAQLSAPPQVFISGSAVGYYGNRPDGSVDEASAAGTGFLAEVCQEWEDAAQPARDASIRTACIRTGYVLTPSGGFLGKQLLPAKLGLGGPIGGGHQVQSWVHIADWIGGVKHILRTTIAGPVNLTAPAPVSQRDFARELGKQLHRPARMPLPGGVLKAALGGFAVEILEGARVLPHALERSGYAFAFPELAAALQDVL